MCGEASLEIDRTSIFSRNVSLGRADVTAKGDVMKRTTSFLGLFGLLILTAACSGTDGPAPLPARKVDS